MTKFWRIPLLLLFFAFFVILLLITAQNVGANGSNNTKFSVAGANSLAKVEEVVPSSVSIEPYSWNKTPNPNSSLQMIRSCDGNPRFPTGNLNNPYLYCWNQQTNSIKNYWCFATPGGNGTCSMLDIGGIDNSVHSFAYQARQNPDWIWLIGNEPDNSFGQDDMSFQEYALFYGTVWHNLKQEYDNTYGVDTYKPKLVFCQSTFADREVSGWGLNYCDNAFSHLWNVILPNLGISQTSLSPSDLVYALSTHHYMPLGTEIINGQVYSGGSFLSEEIIDYSVNTFWEDSLLEFEHWSSTADYNNDGQPDFSNIPLWLTEFGSLNSWCFEIHVENPQELNWFCNNIGPDDEENLSQVESSMVVC